MSLHIVIDGYNLIRQSPSLSAIELNSLEEGRDALIDRLACYRRLKHFPITVVFDGAMASNDFEGERSRRKGIDVLFSRSGELADSVIKRLVVREGAGAVVVTSDKEVADFAARHGAAPIASHEFENRMDMAVQLDASPNDFGEEEGWTPTTKKRGPSRRRSKRERRRRTRTQKL